MSSLPASSSSKPKSDSSNTILSPSDFLKSVLGKQVIVRLNSGVDYKGTLIALDGYMNITLEQAVEYVYGTLKVKFGGDVLIRGNNVLFIAPEISSSKITT